MVCVCVCVRVQAQEVISEKPGTAVRLLYQLFVALNRNKVYALHLHTYVSEP